MSKALCCTTPICFFVRRRAAKLLQQSASHPSFPTSLHISSIISVMVRTAFQNGPPALVWLEDSPQSMHGATQCQTEYRRPAHNKHSQACLQAQHLQPQGSAATGTRQLGTGVETNQPPPTTRHKPLTLCTAAPPAVPALPSDSTPSW